MYCSSCGKAIPDDSVFCMYCGKPPAGQPSLAVRPDTPPTYIRSTFGWLDGPTVIKRPDGGGLFSKKEHRGFAIAIILADEAGRQTTADGTFRLKLYLRRPGLGWRKLEKVIGVSKAEFSLHEFRGLAVTYDWAFIYRHHEPILYDYRDLFSDPNYCAFHYDVWFKPTGDQELYSKGEIPWN